MARQTVITLVDDLDGGAADQTMRFSLNGTSYEIDLSSKNAQELEAAFEPWISASRIVGRSTGRRKTSSAGGVDPKAVRAWAASKKLAVPARGRISRALIEQYLAAGN